ncbi:MAG: TonB C-terminal domain-containing protein, partial [Stellaceae bacterium]
MATRGSSPDAMPRRNGYIASGFLHLVLVLLFVFGLPDLFRQPLPAATPLVVQIVKIGPETRATQITHTPPKLHAKPKVTETPPTPAPKPKPKPKPVPPRPAPPKPPTQLQRPAPTPPKPEPKPQPKPKPVVKPAPAPEPAPA